MQTAVKVKPAATLLGRAKRAVGVVALKGSRLLKGVRQIRVAMR